MGRFENKDKIISMCLGDLCFRNAPLFTIIRFRVGFYTQVLL